MQYWATQLKHTPVSLMNACILHMLYDTRTYLIRRSVLVCSEDSNDGDDFEFFLSTDDANWNPVEWERAAEELTWERVRFLLFSQN